MFLRRSFSFILPLVLVFALIAAACSSDDSSDDGQVATADGETAETTGGTDDPDAGESTDAAAADTTDDGSSTDTTDGTEDPPPVSGEVDPEIAGSLIGQLLGAPGDEAATTCVVDDAATNAALNEVLVGVGQPDFTFTPERFSALAISIQGCVGNESAAEALRPLAGAEAPAQDAALACMQPLLAAGDGAETYAALAAISVGLPPLETGIPLAVGALTDCVEVDTIVEQLAGQAESEQGFAIEIDRDCVADNFGTEETSAFWESIVRQDTTMIDTVETITADCSSAYDSGLLKEVPADFEEWSGEGTLALVDPQLRDRIYSGPPPMVIDPDANYEAILTTERGVIRIKLFPDVAPNTVNNFVALARDGFYDNIFFHRVLDNFMVQGGDPSNTGSGSPGYTFDDEVDNDLELNKRGLLAMANAGPSTNGSQWFITFVPTEWLTGLHTIFGELIEGDDVLSSIRLRDPAAPTHRGDMLISVEIVES